MSETLPARSSRDRALALASQIPDHYTKRIVESSLRQGSSLNEMVRAFHTLYNLPIVKSSQAREDFSHISKERLAMRFSLVVEEMMELFRAMDIRCEMNFWYLDEDEIWTRAHGHGPIEIDHDETSDDELDEITVSRVFDAITNTEERNMPEVADACFDLKYVIIGLEYELGIDPQFCAEEGHASNMSKLMPDGTVLRRMDGKVLKGSNYFKADMRIPLTALGMQFGPATKVTFDIQNQANTQESRPA